MKFQPKNQPPKAETQTETAKPTESQEKTNSFSDDGSHLEILSIEHITGESEQESPAGEAGPGPDVSPESDNSRNMPPEALEKEAFYQQFAGAHKIISLMTGLSSMAIQPNEQESAMEASAAIYDTAVDMEWYWMISPGGKWFQRLSVLGMFFVGKAQMVAQERAAIMAEMEKEQQNQQQNSENQSSEAPKDDTTPPAGWEWMKEAGNVK